MIKVITPMSKHIIALTPHSDRAELGVKLKEEIEKFNKNVESFESYETAFKKALSIAREDDLILVTGSLYMIGEMRGIINHIVKQEK